MNKLLKLAKAKRLIGMLTIISLMIVPILSVSPVLASETSKPVSQTYLPSAEAAFESALAAYMREVKPKHPFEISERKVEDAWAYAVASVDDEHEEETYLHSHEFIVLLARREGDAGWLAIAPEIVSAKQYNDWLADFPDSLIDESTRAYLHRSESTRRLLNFSSHKLPWPNGQTGYVTRKNGSGHGNQVDFDILGGGSSGNVYASKPGTVVFVKESSNSGCNAFACWQQANMVVVKNASNEYSWYVHLAHNSVPVSVGQTIGFGTKIGVEGNTGYSSEVHLHYMASTGHSSWTDPNNANTAPWGTGITAVDFVEASWNSLTAGQQYTSQNAGSSCCGCMLAARQPTNDQPQSDYSVWLASQLDPSSRSSSHDALLGLAYQTFPSGPSAEIDAPSIETIDTTPPLAPTDLESKSHRLDAWSSERAIDVAWTSSQEEAGESGLAGYAYSWDQVPESEPEGHDLLPPNAIRAKAPALADGTWYFHLQALDQAGNRSETVHLGPFLIDGSAPELDVASPQTNLTNQPQLETFSWAPASDEGELKGYYVYWGEDEGGTSETLITERSFTPEETIAADSAATRYLRLAALDAAGNLSAWQTAATWHYDNVAPTSTLTIGSGGEMVRSLHVTLNLEAEDADSALSQMRFSADGKEWTAWEAYSPRRQWQLENHAERQPVYAQVRDEAGNLSDVTKSSVVAQLKAPAPTSSNYQLVRRALTMGGGEKSSNSYTVRGNSGQAHQTGHLQGSNYQVKSGFWAGISQDQPPSCYMLTTAAAPLAGGSISASPTPNCAGDKYQDGTTVTLTANASSGYTFSHWSGDVSGSSNQTSVTMNGNQSVTANFSTNPSNAVLSSSVTLQGRPALPDPRWIVPLNVSLTIAGESTPAYEFTPTTDENGNFTIVDVEPGTYDIRVKKSTTLQNMETVTLVEGDNSFDFGILREGDANNDNFVTILDFSILAGTFGKCEGSSGYDERADFNGDGCVTILDFSLLASNFGQSGDNREMSNLSPPTVERQVGLMMDSVTVDTEIGDNICLPIHAQAGSQTVDGVAAYLNFDPSQLQVKQLTLSDVFSLELTKQFDNQQGTIDIAVGTFDTFPSGSFHIAEACFEVIDENVDASITFQFDSPRQSDVTFNGFSVLSNHSDGRIMRPVGPYQLHLPLIVR